MVSLSKCVQINLGIDLEFFRNPILVNLYLMLLIGASKRIYSFVDPIPFKTLFLVIRTPAKITYLVDFTLSIFIDPSGNFINNTSLKNIFIPFKILTQLR